MISRKRSFLAACLGMAFGFTPAILAAEPSSQVFVDAPNAGLDHLRAAMSDAYNRGDIDAIVRYLDPDVVIIFPDASVSKGREAFRDYYNRMLHGPDHRVASYSAEPVIE